MCRKIAQQSMLLLRLLFAQIAFGWVSTQESISSMQSRPDLNIHFWDKFCGLSRVLPSFPMFCWLCLCSVVVDVGLERCIVWRIVVCVVQGDQRPSRASPFDVGQTSAKRSNVLRFSIPVSPFGTFFARFRSSPLFVWVLCGECEVLLRSNRGILPSQAVSFAENEIFCEYFERQVWRRRIFPSVLHNQKARNSATFHAEPQETPT